ncbi:MAG: hypothetical protein E7437_08760 [Ruminococcaceae bacterium]|nr:hypothetical protein [Oscillospiraceae bacterium]
MQTNQGQLSNCDITTEQASDSGLKIKNFQSARLKGASYDITPSIIAMSSRTGMLETVYRESVYPFHHYIIVSAKDSILVVSNEFFDVPDYIAGHVVSRVSKVVDGFGHISTSIDPGWQGAMLIALSNPSNKPIKVRVGTSLYNEASENPLATVSFHYLATPAKLDGSSSYPGMRLDLLKKCCYNNRQGLRAWWQRCIHPSRRKFTDFFFAYCQVHHLDLNINGWDKFIKTFSGRPNNPAPPPDVIPNDAKEKKKYPWDYIVQESLWTRFLFFKKRHQQTLNIILITLFLMLIVLDIIPESIVSLLSNLINNGG